MRLSSSGLGLFKAVSKETATLDWMLKGVIQSNSLGAVIGASGSYKTFVILDMAMHVSNGRNWQGHKTKKSPIVLYVAGEGHAGISNRVNAIAKETGLSTDRFLISNTSIDMYSTENIEKLKNVIHELEEDVWVIIDTLNRNFTGDENSAKDTAVLFSNLDSLRAIGATTTIVHHTGHSESGRARGSSALKGAMDWEIITKFDKSKGAITVLNTKQKEGMAFEKMTLSPKVVLIGLDEDGDRITSVVIKNGSKKDNMLEEAANAVYNSLPSTHGEINDLIANVSGKEVSTVKSKYKVEVKEYLLQHYTNFIIDGKEWKRKLDVSVSKRITYKKQPPIKQETLTPKMVSSLGSGGLKQLMEEGLKVTMSNEEKLKVYNKVKIKEECCDGVALCGKCAFESRI